MSIAASPDTFSFSTTPAPRNPLCPDFLYFGYPDAGIPTFGWFSFFSERPGCPNFLQSGYPDAGILTSGWSANLAEGLGGPDLLYFGYPDAGIPTSGWFVCLATCSHQFCLPLELGAASQLISFVFAGTILSHWVGVGVVESPASASDLGLLMISSMSFSRNQKVQLTLVVALLC